MGAGDLIDRRVATDDRWMSDAACTGLTYLFFPDAAERPQSRAAREARARAVCASCAVRIECRDYARHHHEYGMWGGESEDERHAAGYRLIAPIGLRVRDTG